MTITIYHNPRCGTSRNTLELIRNTGEKPEIIDYLTNPPAREELLRLIAAMGMPVCDLVRSKEALFRELNLDAPSVTDDVLIDAMLTHPVLMNRPVVVTPLGTKLCRPSEEVLTILPLPQLGEFTKEDGEKVIDKNGKRIVVNVP